ncbi:MAG: hypothetical protein IPH07_24400 [Deltaproteobacteria bacterium]|nr:hypothetical protein [Deltaproteobacteria bacterium]
MRQLRGCTRFDLPPVQWEVDEELIAFHHGAPRDLERPGLGTCEKPTERPEHGCPGGYQRARVLQGLHRYYRRRTDDGARVQNPFFDACDDWLIHAAILYLEHEEERCAGDRERVWHDQRKREVNRG